MTATTECRAKDKTRCWKHGTQQGIIANEKITKLLDMQDQGYLKPVPTHFIEEKSLKTMNGPVLAYTLLSYAEAEPTIDHEKVSKALRIASELHRKDTRANRGPHDRTAYIEHPLRNALRSIRYGCNDTDQIVASILHDTVEDNPIEFSAKYAGHVTTDEAEAREHSFRYIRDNFSPRAEHIVRGVSNPLQDTTGWALEDKNKLYYEHVKESIQDPDTFVVKVCDFIDNAGSLHHNVGKGLNPEGIRRRCLKYLPVATLLQERLNDTTNPINMTAEQKQKLYNQLEAIKKRLQTLSGTKKP